MRICSVAHKSTILNKLRGTFSKHFARNRGARRKLLSPANLSRDFHPLRHYWEDELVSNKDVVKSESFDRVQSQWQLSDTLAGKGGGTYTAAFEIRIPASFSAAKRLAYCCLKQFCQLNNIPMKSLDMTLWAIATPAGCSGAPFKIVSDCFSKCFGCSSLLIQGAFMWRPNANHNSQTIPGEEICD